MRRRAATGSGGTRTATALTRMRCSTACSATRWPPSTSPWATSRRRGWPSPSTRPCWPPTAAPPAVTSMPKLTGAPYPGEAWAPAASLRPAGASSGTMQRASGIVERCFVGHDPTRLYLRLDLRRPIDDFDTLIYLSGPPAAPANQRVDVTFSDPDMVPRELAAAWLVRPRRGAERALPLRGRRSCRLARRRPGHFGGRREDAGAGAAAREPRPPAGR